MPFERPTLVELNARIGTDLRSRLERAGAPLRRSVIAILATVWAGAVHMLHGFLEFLSKQIFADQSEREYLLRHASLYGLSPKPPEYATGSVVVTGEDGTLIDDGTLMRRSDGVEYVTSDATIMSGGQAVCPVIAVLAGATANADAGTVLTLESPIEGADSTVTVVLIEGGTEVEGIEDLRARLLARIQDPPEGGAETDYRQWALAVPGVTRVWVYPRQLGAGTVVVRFVRDNDMDSIFPGTGEVDAVQDYIDARRPVTAAVTVAAPVAKAWNFTIAVEPDTTPVREAVEAELVDLFRREAQPGETIKLWKVERAIATAAGLTDYTLTSPAADLTHATGELATVGTITWS